MHILFYYTITNHKFNHFKHTSVCSTYIWKSIENFHKLLYWTIWYFSITLKPLTFPISFPGVIYLRSHLGKYLSVDQFGNVLCESDERDAGSRFQISIADDNTGKWALKNEQRGYFLGGNPEKLTCTAKTPSKGEFWSVHLAARPQVSMNSKQNKIIWFPKKKLCTYVKKKRK